MNESMYKKLNPTEAINEALPRIIEAFVLFYGEEERENIEAKFKNMLVIGYVTPDNIEYMIKVNLNAKSKELKMEFLNNIGVSDEQKKEFEKIFFSSYDFNYASLHPFDKYMGYIDGDVYQKYQVVALVKNFYPEVTIENIDELRESGKLSLMDKYVEEYKKILEKYQQYKLLLKKYEDYVEKCKKQQAELENKYTKILVQELSFLFTKEELQQIEANFNGPNVQRVKNVNNKTKCYFGYDLSCEALIDAFSEKSEILLETGGNWRQKSVMNDRVAYFKNMGLNLGDNYENYLNNEEVKKLLPVLKETAEKVITKRNEIYTRMMNEYYQALEEYQKNIVIIKQAGLLDKEHGYDANAYALNGKFVSSNVKKTEDGYISYPMLCFGIADSEYLDHCLIHELNHIYELHLLGVEDNMYLDVCGWDLCGGTFDREMPQIVSLEERAEKRNYELLNEIINEMIAQEITGILFENNGYIFNSKEDAKIKGATSYEKMRFIVEEFYNTYKKEIIASRKLGDVTILYNAVGEENFEALNKLFEIFHQNFAGFEYFQVKNSIDKGEETEKTKLFKQIVEKRNEILLAMAEYRKSHSSELRGV